MSLPAVAARQTTFAITKPKSLKPVSRIRNRIGSGTGLDPEPDWIRNRIGSGTGLDQEPDWIRNRIGFGSNGSADLDPDPGRPKMSPKKEKKEEFHV